MPIGTSVDVFDPEILAELEENGENHPVRKLRENRDKWKTIFTGNEKWEKFDAHTAVDTPDDYWNLTEAVEKAGYKPLEVTRFLSEKS